MVNDCGAEVCPVPSCTVTLKVNEPPVVGVPLIVPEAFSDSPAGIPALAAQFFKGGADVVPLKVKDG